MFLNKNMRLLPLLIPFFLLTPSLSKAAVDRYDDLAIGIPYQAIEAIVNAGGVSVLYGHSTGLSVVGKFDDQFWNMDSQGIEGTATVDDEFGTSLTAGDFNGDGYQDLTVSAGPWPPATLMETDISIWPSVYRMMISAGSPVRGQLMSSMVPPED